MGTEKRVFSTGGPRSSRLSMMARVAGRDTPDQEATDSTIQVRTCHSLSIRSTTQARRALWWASRHASCRGPIPPGCRVAEAARREAESRRRVRRVVFATPKGTPLDAQNVVNRHFKPLLRRASLPDVRRHDLRHSCFTLLLSRGVHPKFVQHLAGAS